MIAEKNGPKKKKKKIMLIKLIYDVLTPSVPHTHEPSSATLKAGRFLVTLC